MKHGSDLQSKAGRIRDLIRRHTAHRAVGPLGDSRELVRNWRGESMRASVVWHGYFNLGPDGEWNFQKCAPGFQPKHKKLYSLRIVVPDDELPPEVEARIDVA